MLRTLSLAILGFVCLGASDAFAQGLIWKLPADGTWIRYEGTYKQVEARPNNPQGNRRIDWIQHVTIKSVGSEMREFQGEETACRWLEFKIQTGKAQQGAIATGSVGERIYKVLVPEKAIIGKTIDNDGIPVDYLPIVDGYRKTNEKNPTPQKLKHGVFHIFPVVSLIRHHKQYEEPTDQTVAVKNQDVDSKLYRAVFDRESLTERLKQETQLYRADEMPFGVVKWIVKVNQDRKAEIDGRTEFTFQSEVTVEMTAVEVGDEAKSELVLDDAGM